MVGGGSAGGGVAESSTGGIDVSDEAEEQALWRPLPPPQERALWNPPHGDAACETALWLQRLRALARERAHRVPAAVSLAATASTANGTATDYPAVGGVGTGCDALTLGLVDGPRTHAARQAGEAADAGAAGGSNSTGVGQAALELRAGLYVGDYTNSFYGHFGKVAAHHARFHPHPSLFTPHPSRLTPHSSSLTPHS